MLSESASWRGRGRGRGRGLRGSLRGSLRGLLGRRTCGRAGRLDERLARPVFAVELEPSPRPGLRLSRQRRGREYRSLRGAKSFGARSLDSKLRGPSKLRFGRAEKLPGLRGPPKEGFAGLSPKVRRGGRLSEESRSGRGVNSRRGGRRESP